MSAAPGRALVLTAGLGTRLRPLTSVRAKPAIPVAGEPLIRRIITWLAASGITDLVLNLHHLPATLTSVVGDGSDLAARVRYSWENPILGSAGGPRLATPLLGADTFFIVNGDTLTDVNPLAVLDAHRGARATVTLAVVPNTQPLRYGGVLLDGAGAVSGFVRRGPGAAGSYHFIGVQVARAEAFSTVTAGTAADSIGGVYDEHIARRPGSIRAYVCDASFWDVGTPRDYVETSRAFDRSDVVVGRRSKIHRSAVLTRTILWDDVTIGPECRLDGCIVTDRVNVPARFERTHAVLLAAPDGGVTVSPLPQD